jgi:hypothetical protein
MEPPDEVAYFNVLTSRKPSPLIIEQENIRLWYINSAWKAFVYGLKVEMHRG